MSLHINEYRKDELLPYYKTEKLEWSLLFHYLRLVCEEDWLGQYGTTLNKIAELPDVDKKLKLHISTPTNPFTDFEIGDIVEIERLHYFIYLGANTILLQPEKKKQPQKEVQHWNTLEYITEKLKQGYKVNTWRPINRGNIEMSRFIEVQTLPNVDDASGNSIYIIRDSQDQSHGKLFIKEGGEWCEIGTGDATEMGEVTVAEKGTNGNYRVYISAENANYQLNWIENDGTSTTTTLSDLVATHNFRYNNSSRSWVGWLPLKLKSRLILFSEALIIVSIFYLNDYKEIYNEIEDEHFQQIADDFNYRGNNEILLSTIEGADFTDQGTVSETFKLDLVDGAPIGNKITLGVDSVGLYIDFTEHIRGLLEFTNEFYGLCKTSGLPKYENLPIPEALTYSDININGTNAVSQPIVILRQNGQHEFGFKDNQNIDNFSWDATDPIHPKLYIGQIDDIESVKIDGQIYSEILYPASDPWIQTSTLEEITWMNDVVRQNPELNEKYLNRFFSYTDVRMAYSTEKGFSQDYLMQNLKKLSASKIASLGVVFGDNKTVIINSTIKPHHTDQTSTINQLADGIYQIVFDNEVSIFQLFEDANAQVPYAVLENSSDILSNQYLVEVQAGVNIPSIGNWTVEQGQISKIVVSTGQPSNSTNIIGMKSAFNGETVVVKHESQSDYRFGHLVGRGSGNDDYLDIVFEATGGGSTKGWGGISIGASDQYGNRTIIVEADNDQYKLNYTSDNGTNETNTLSDLVANGSLNYSSVAKNWIGQLALGQGSHIFLMKDGTQEVVASDYLPVNNTYTLPVANSTTLGGVQPVNKSNAHTMSVGVDANGRLWSQKDTTPNAVKRLQAGEFEVPIACSVGNFGGLSGETMEINHIPSFTIANPSLLNEGEYEILGIGGITFIFFVNQAPNQNKIKIGFFKKNQYGDWNSWIDIYPEIDWTSTNSITVNPIQDYQVLGFDTTDGLETAYMDDYNSADIIQYAPDFLKFFTETRVKYRYDEWSSIYTKNYVDFYCEFHTWQAFSRCITGSYASDMFPMLQRNWCYKLRYEVVTGGGEMLFHERDENSYFYYGWGEENWDNYGGVLTDAINVRIWGNTITKKKADGTTQSYQIDANAYVNNGLNEVIVAQFRII